MHKSFFSHLGLVTQIGALIIASALIGLLIGLFIDKKTGSKGIFAVIFLIFGIIGGFYNAYKEIMRRQK